MATKEFFIKCVKATGEFLTENSLTLRDIWRNIRGIGSQTPLPPQPIAPLPPQFLAPQPSPPSLFPLLKTVAGVIMYLIGIGELMSRKFKVRLSTYKQGDGVVLIRGRERIIPGRHAGTVFVGIVTDSDDADVISDLLKGVDWTTMLADDVSKELMKNVGSIVGMLPFVLTIVAGDQIHVASRGNFRCVKAIFVNGGITHSYVDISTSTITGRRFGVGSSLVEENDVFLVLGSYHLWVLLTPTEVISLVSHGRRKEAAQIVAAEAIRRAGNIDLLHLYVAIIYFK